MLEDIHDKLPLWRGFQSIIQVLLDAILSQSNSVLSIESRVKTIEGIRAKLSRKGLKDVNDLTDIVGFRIVVKDVIDIRKVYDLLASQLKIIDSALYDGTNYGKLKNAFSGVSIQYHVKRDPYEQLNIVIGVDDSRAILPEWKDFASFVGEIQVVSAFGNAWLKASHAYHYKEGGILPDVANLTVTARLSVILNNFKLLVEKDSVHEKHDLHPFLKEYPFILHPNPTEVWSEVAIGIGTEFRMDFLIRESDGSYLLVEIENVRHKIFTKEGDFSAAVNHAQRQVEDWQEWVEENLPMVQRKYPDIIAPKGLVIIGRSKDLNQDERRRLARRNINMRGRMTIWTYDELIENATQFIESLKRNLGESA